MASTASSSNNRLSKKLKAASVSPVASAGAAAVADPVVVDPELEDADPPVALAPLDAMKFEIVAALVALKDIGNDSDILFAYQCLNAVMNESDEHYEGVQAVLCRLNMTAEVFVEHVMSARPANMSS